MVQVLISCSGWRIRINRRGESGRENLIQKYFIYSPQINIEKKSTLGLEVRLVHKDTKINIQGGIVLDGFPSTGLVNAIATECLIRSADTELIGVVDSPGFPWLSMIWCDLTH